MVTSKSFFSNLVKFTGVGKMSIPSFLFFLAILIIYILCTILLARYIYFSCIKKEFRRKYRLGVLPSSIYVRAAKKKERSELAYYDLNYPLWEHPKSDESKDARYKRNSIIWKKSVLHLPDYIVYTSRPYDLIAIIHNLRIQGVNIEKSPEEKHKYQKACHMTVIQQSQDKAASIVKLYADNPTGFEQFCAELFVQMGFSASVTPKTNDGGYDILLHDDQGSTIVECKCYSLTHKVGRPAIQKLVGANRIVMARSMCFVTTSSFSDAAVVYAKQVGVRLIDGIELSSILSRINSEKQHSPHISLSQWELTIQDMQFHVPNDIYNKYFIS